MNKKIITYFVITLFVLFNMKQATHANRINIIENRQIITDPRIELVSIVLFLTNEKIVSDLNYFETQYLKDIKSHFSQFSQHDAIILCKELLHSGFNSNAPMEFSLYHTCPPQFVKEVEYTERLISRANSRKVLEEFADELRDFSVESNFEVFYEAHHDYYQSLIQNVILEMERKRGFIYIEDLNELMEKYEDERGQYAIYEDFYPIIIEYFKNKVHQLDNHNKN